MSEEKDIVNPWIKNGLFRNPTYHRRTWQGHRFILRHSSVVAVKDGKAITECVTIDGAIRHLTRMREA